MSQAMTHRNWHLHRTRDADDNTDHDRAVVDRTAQRAEFGGFHFGSAFFGWLVATGLGALLTALLVAGGAAVAVTSINAVTPGTAATVGFVSGLLLLIALAIAYYAGGYVAGRMARFDGARQGFGTWLIGVIITLILGGVGAAAGAKYNIMQGLNLPHLPINQGSFTTGGLITTLLILVVTLLAALYGGRRGARYHEVVDTVGEMAEMDREAPRHKAM